MRYWGPIAMLPLIIGCAAPGAIKTQSAPMICDVSAKILVKSSKPTVDVAYEEPTTSIDGSPLTALEKTSIYYDLGDGPVKAMDVPASKPQGGGHVSKVVPIPLGGATEKMTTICVTASNKASAPQSPPPSGPQWHPPWR